MLGTIPIKAGIEQGLKGQSGFVLSLVLLVIAGIIIFIALSRGHPLVKAGAIAWIVLP